MRQPALLAWCWALGTLSTTADPARAGSAVMQCGSVHGFVAAAALGDGGDKDALQSFHAGNSMLNRGLNDLAIKEYRDFLAAQPRHEKADTARYGMAVALHRLGKFGEAAETLAPLARKVEFAFGAESAYLLAQCHVSQSQWSQAAEAYQGLVKRWPDHALAEKSAAVAVEMHFRSGANDKALGGCDQFVQNHPKSDLRGRTAFFGGMSAMSLEDFEQASKWFELVTEASGDDELRQRSGVLLAHCLRRQNLIDKAVRQYRKAIEHAGGELLADALAGLAAALQSKGDTVEATATFERLAREFPDRASSDNRIAWARTLVDQQRYDEAIDVLGRVDRKDPQLGDDAAYWIAKCHLRAGRFAEAAKLLDRCTQRYKTSELLPQMRYDRAFALMKLGDAKSRDAALEAARDLCQQHDDHPLATDGYYIIALLENQNRQYDKSDRACDAFAKRAGAAQHASAADVAFIQAENAFQEQRYAEAARQFGSFRETHGDDARHGAAMMRQALALLRSDHVDAALPLLESAARMFEDNADGNAGLDAALPLLADARFDRGEWKQAEAAYQAHLNSGGTAGAELLLRLGLAQAHQSEHQKAVVTFERLQESFGDHALVGRAMLEQANCLLALQRDDDAAACLKALTQRDGDTALRATAHYMLGDQALRQSRPQDAAIQFAKSATLADEKKLKAVATYQTGASQLAAGAFTDAIDSLQLFVRDFPADDHAAEGAARLAIALSRAERFDEALQAISAVRKDRRWKLLDDSLRSALSYEEAWCLRQTGDETRAAAVLASLSEQGGGTLGWQARIEAAEIEHRSGHAEKAAEMLAELPAVADKAGIAGVLLERGLYRLGVSLFESNRFSDAAAVLADQLKRSPDGPLALSAALFCGDALMHDGKHSAAAGHLRRAAESKSDEVRAPALLRLGECQAQLHKWRGSEESFGDYLSRYADSKQWFTAQFGIAWARENQQRYDEAISAYRQIVEKHKGPTAARAQFQIGECLFAAGKHEEAARELLRVDILYAYPEWSSAALYEAGRCFEALKRGDDARNQYKAVVERFGDSEFAKLSRERLARIAPQAVPGR